MLTTQKITVNLPSDLVHDAQCATGKNLTETIRQGLRLLSAQKAYQNMLKLRGQVSLNLSLADMRYDRSRHVELNQKSGRKIDDRRK